MSKRIYVVPRAGLVVRDPITGDKIPPEGEWKNDGPAWRRLSAPKRGKPADITIHSKEPSSAAAKKEGKA